MLPRLPHFLLCPLVLFAVAASLPASAQMTGHPAATPTSTNLSCTTTGPASQHESIPLIATVTSNNGTPSGTVNFTEDNISIGTAQLTNGAATLNAIVYAGTNTFVATFPEQDGYAGSSATCGIQAGPLSLSSNNNPALAFSPITFIAGLAIAPFPGGNFTFSINGGLPLAPNGGGRNPSFAAYTIDTLAAGTYTVTATFIPADGSAPYTASITQVVTTATGDFTLTGYPPTLTLRDGLTATGLIAATSVNDFHGPVSLSCALPQTLSYTCTLAPTSLQLLLNDYQTSTLTLAPSKPSAALTRRPLRGRSPSHTLFASLLPLSLLSFAAFAGRRRSRFHGPLCLIALALLAGSTTACGPDIFSVATPAGSYPITITATGTTPGEDPITHTLTLTLNLNLTE